MKNPQLWNDLQSFDFDGDAPFSFSRRLARDNGWSAEFALRVVEEYRRFLYLACEAGHPITPSDEVDQAWHLHLTYSRSYWDDLCACVLKQPLHHDPTRGGKAEGAKFENWYARTLESYRAAFGCEPPTDLWPDSEQRFGAAPHFRRVNVRDYWMVTKPRVRFPRMDFPHVERRGFRIATVLPVISLVLFLTGCAEYQNEGPNVFNWHGGEFLAFFWILSAVAIGFSIWIKNQSGRPLDAAFPMQPVDAYDVARLKDSKNLAADVAIATLYEKGKIEVTPEGTLRTTRASVVLKPFEQAVLARIDASGSSVLETRRSLESHIAVIDNRLRDWGLLVDKQSAQQANAWPIGVTVGLLALGMVKVAVGLSRDRPVGFLLVSCALLIGVLIYFCTHPIRRSKRGDLFLIHLKSQPNRQAVTDIADLLALQFALVGMAAFPADVQRAMRPPSSGGDSGGSGCSSSSGGDSGGGCGGGGCGGCGGGD